MHTSLVWLFLSHDIGLAPEQPRNKTENKYVLQVILPDAIFPPVLWFMLQAVLVTRHKTKMKTVSAIREFTTELQLYFHMWVTSVSPWDASGGHSRAALGRCCSLLSKDQAQSPHYWSIPLKNPLSKTDLQLQLQWIHWIQISFNKTWINPMLENRIYNVTRFPGTTFDDYVHGDIICDIYLEPNTENESNWSSTQPQIQRHTLSFKHLSNVEQKSACADCLEVGIQVLSSFSEVTPPILCITDSLFNSNPGVPTWGAWWDILMIISAQNQWETGGEVKNWGSRIHHP